VEKSFRERLWKTFTILHPYTPQSTGKEYPKPATFVRRV
jgi:hypothetical protein